MKVFTRKCIILVCAVAAIGQATIDTASAQVVPGDPVPPMTLWRFLGIPQGARKVSGALLNRRGNFPGMERGIPLRALNDPRNLFSEDAAIKRAAEIKIQEDLKPQKIKSIKFLASIGCACYDQDDSITKALIKATQDCTEEVRLTAVEQVKEAASGACCSNCGTKCCCKEDMLKRLAQMAYHRDETGCYLEPSERVREAAAEALEECCPSGGPIIEAVEEEEIPTPPQTPVTPGTNGEQPPKNQEEAPRNEEEAPITDDNDPNADGSTDTTGTGLYRGAQRQQPAPRGLLSHLSRRLGQQQKAQGNAGRMSQPKPAPQRVQQPTPRKGYLQTRTNQNRVRGKNAPQPPKVARATKPQPSQAPIVAKSSRRRANQIPKWSPTRNKSNTAIVGDSQFAPPLPQTLTPVQQTAAKTRTSNRSAVLVHADARRGLAHIHFGANRVKPRIGQKLNVYRTSNAVRVLVGRVEVIQVFDSSVNVKAVSRADLAAIKKGYVVDLPKVRPVAKSPQKLTPSHRAVKKVSHEQASSRRRSPARVVSLQPITTLR